MALPNPLNFLKRILTKSFWTSRVNFLFGDQARYTRGDYLDAYEACGIVNTCVDRIAEGVADMELQLYRYQRGHVGEVDEHPLLDLINQVNPFMTRHEMLEMIETFVKLLGNAYLLKLRNERKKVIALWPLRPDWVSIKYDSEKFIGYYEYNQPGLLEKYAPEDIIHFKQVNPKDQFYGMGTVQPAIDIIKTIIFTTRWNMNFFYNSARPDALLISKTKISKEEKEEFRKQWYAKYGGWESAHRLGLLEGEIDYKPISYTMRDMDFARLHDISVNDILAIFGVPKPVISMTTDLNRATADAAIYMFLRGTIKPDMRKIVEKLNEYLVPEFGDNLYLDFKDPVPEDRDATLREYDNAIKNNWMVVNEVRGLEGLPPIEGGWDIYLPITMLPVGGVEEGDRERRTAYQKIGTMDPKKYEKWQKDKRQKELKKKILPRLKIYKLKESLKKELKKELLKYLARTNREKLSEEKKAVLWKEHDKLLTSDERLFKLMVKKLFKNQEARITDALASAPEEGKGVVTKLGFEVLVDWEMEKTIFVEIAKPVFLDIIKRRGERAAGLVGGEFQITSRISEFIDRKAFKFADEVNDTTKDKLKETLTEGVDLGEGVDKLTKRVGKVFDDRTGYESERIARTEVISASNEADLEAYKQSKVVEEKEWLATMDDRVRDSHAMMNGEVVGISQKFSNGLRFPGDPSGPAEEVVNCRCALLPCLE